MEPQSNHYSVEYLSGYTELLTLTNIISVDQYFDQFLRLFYQECQKDKTLFSMNGKFDVTKLTMDHMLRFQAHIESFVAAGKMKKWDKDLMISNLYKLCQNLTKDGLARIYYPPPSNKKKASKPKKLISFPIISEFEAFMTLRHYSPKTIHDYTTSVHYFLRHASYHSETENENVYWYEKTNEFIHDIQLKAKLKHIQESTAYSYLKAIKLFIKFLNSNKKLNIPFTMPNKKQLNKEGKRTNEYVNMHDLNIFLETIFTTSKHVLRDISIVLILLETGCRPIEVINLGLDDLTNNQKLIVLRSKKSLQRTLSLEGMSKTFLKKYLQIRKNYVAESDTQALFLSSSGLPLHRGYISQLFRQYNLRAFSQIRFTPKTLRHAFITDALNSNGNDIEQVRETVGHKHLASTHYYFFKDVNKLKEQIINIPFMVGIYEEGL